MSKYLSGLIVICILFIGQHVFGQINPDQLYFINGIDSISKYIDSKSNVVFDEESNSVMLDSTAKEGYFILKPYTFEYGFDEGLPSWNGFAPKDQMSSFKVFMRFETASGWSDWLTVGFWDKNVWSSYGTTSFSGGKVNIDEVSLYQYLSTFQFKVVYKRFSSSYQSARVNQLSFFVSDSQTTNNVNINAIVDDDPEQVFIDTEFIYQYDVDDAIGGSICSPTSTTMNLLSYGIDVDVYDFSVRTKDPKWNLFGVWPRAVVHASEYGVESKVTRYRTWSEAREVLNNGGRIAISVGKPLYSGHLIMLAGFDEFGNPIVHDSAIRDGYSKKFDKRALSESWFNKGGISYTFYEKDVTASVQNVSTHAFKNIKAYPNPFDDFLNLEFTLNKTGKVSIDIFDLNGKCVYSFMKNESLSAGYYNFNMLASKYLSKSGTYILVVRSGPEKLSKIIYKK